MFDFADGRETERDRNIRAIPQQMCRSDSCLLLIGSFILLPPYSGREPSPLFTGVVNTNCVTISGAKVKAYFKHFCRVRWNSPRIAVAVDGGINGGLRIIECLWPRWDEPTAALFTLRSWRAEAGDLPRKRLFKWKCSFSRADQILITAQRQQHGSVSSRKRSYLQIFTLQPVYLEAQLPEEIMSRACVPTSFEPNV